MSISSIRKEYRQAAFSEEAAADDPFRQFDRWWSEALHSGIEEVNAMVLSTVASSGMPSSRTVLLKGYDGGGFVFYTNYESNKGRELERHPFASLLFFWKELERQVRIEGGCKRVSEAESDAYFASRPEGSRIGAWASPQSRVIPSREYLDEQSELMRRRFPEDAIPRPPHWGGYRVVPVMVEFWQGRPDRLHDRMRYERSANGTWQRNRLAP